MKKHLFNLLLFTVLVIGLSGCRTSAPKLDYKKLARASVRLGVDIGMEDNHKLYLEAAEWIGTPYRGGGETKRGTDCSGMTCQIYKKVYHTKLQRSTDGQKKESSKVARRNLREGDLVFFSRGSADNRRGQDFNRGMRMKLRIFLSMKWREVDHPRQRCGHRKVLIKVP